MKNLLNRIFETMLKFIAFSMALLIILGIIVIFGYIVDDFLALI